MDVFPKDPLSALKPEILYTFSVIHPIPSQIPSLYRISLSRLHFVHLLPFPLLSFSMIHLLIPDRIFAYLECISDFLTSNLPTSALTLLKPHLLPQITPKLCTS